MTVYGMNHVALEVTDVELAVKFYTEVLGLKLRSKGEGQAFFDVGEHQFLALSLVKEKQPDEKRHIGIVVKDNDEIAEVRRKVEQWGLELNPSFACDFHDPFGNRIQVVDLSVED